MPDGDPRLVAFRALIAAVDRADPAAYCGAVRALRGHGLALATTGVVIDPVTRASRLDDLNASSPGDPRLAPFSELLRDLDRGEDSPSARSRLLSVGLAITPEVA